MAEDKPYALNKKSVYGFLVISAANLEAAAEIAKDCPILNGNGTSEEVREAMRLR
ncbi:YciI family protein [Sphingobacterium lactis]|uniref:YciI family protein n=1 Tax=Sphingobacterium lactis TaxID=797291 RepID=UPI003DA5007C